jgi:hypothetical protein
MLVAYIDAALGSMLLQAMAGLVLAGVVMGRRILAVPFGWIQTKNPESNGDMEEFAEASSDQ